MKSALDLERFATECKFALDLDSACNGIANLNGTRFVLLWLAPDLIWLALDSDWFALFCLQRVSCCSAHARNTSAQHCEEVRALRVASTTLPCEGLVKRRFFTSVNAALPGYANGP